ncbi:hypothetical protein [Methylobacterium sp.]|jgi:hypothetical protein|uniref:hypothetical protein n=1 Tax=Methylobacterium sp. TaxID=409 RepID=UPI00261C00E8|nr:hypothetical protein [Methylobacterium sp.]MDB5645654.1 hypothetical protein [Methylobacterium sp.]
MRQTLWDQIQETVRAREACVLAGRDPDEDVAGYLVDAAGQRHWCRKARWRWYSDSVTGTSTPVEGQDNGPEHVRVDERTRT